MSKKRQRKAIWKELPFLVGLGLTLLVFGGFAYTLFFLPVETADTEYATKWHYLMAATPNEIGDTLAGFAGSLAFVWLVVTVWLQATELREQRDEFEKMADAQEAQVKLLVAQGDIFKDEQRQRDEAAAEAELKEITKYIRMEIGRLSRDEDVWKWGGGSGVQVYHPLKIKLSSANGDWFLKNLYEEIHPSLSFMLQFGTIEFTHKPMGYNTKFDSIIEHFNQILRLRNRISTAMQIRVDSWNISGVIEVFTLLKDPHFWEEPNFLARLSKEEAEDEGD